MKDVEEICKKTHTHTLKKKQTSNCSVEATTEDTALNKVDTIVLGPRSSGLCWVTD